MAPRSFEIRLEPFVDVLERQRQLIFSEKIRNGLSGFAKKDGPRQIAGERRKIVAKVEFNHFRTGVPQASDCLLELGIDLRVDPVEVLPGSINEFYPLEV